MDLETIQASINDRPDRIAKLDSEIKSAQTEFNESKKRLETIEPGDNQFLLYTAESQALELRALMLETESRWQNAVQMLLPLQRDLAQRNLNYQKQLERLIETEVSRLKQLESERAAEEAKQAEFERHPALRQIAEENSELAAKWQQLAEDVERARKKRRATSNRFWANFKPRSMRREPKLTPVELPIRSGSC